MARNYQDIIDLLKKQGVEIGDKAAGAVKEKFGEFVLASAGEIAGEDQVIIKKVDIENLKKFQPDMITYKNKMQKAEAEVKELKDALESGESTTLKMLEKYKAETERLNPLVKKFMDEKRKKWEGAREKIPEQLKPYYAFKKEDGDDLTDSQIMNNISKLDEHIEIKALDLTAEKGKQQQTARTNRIGESSRTGEPEWKGKKAEDKMQAGYNKDGMRFYDDKNED